MVGLPVVWSLVHELEAWIDHFKAGELTVEEFAEGLIERVSKLTRWHLRGSPELAWVFRSPAGPELSRAPGRRSELSGGARRVRRASR